MFDTVKLVWKFSKGALDAKRNYDDVIAVKKKFDSIWNMTKKITEIRNKIPFIGNKQNKEVTEALKNVLAK